jgi:hypothetical protein
MRTKRSTPSTLKKLLVGALVLAGLPLVACHKPKTYEVNVQITRLHAVRKDEAGNALTTDLEITFNECPGTQIDVLRGGKEFGDCMKKYKEGDKIKVKLEHKWDPEGHWDYDVFEAGGCKRPPDPADEASYKLVRDCKDWNVNGAKVGFQCSYAEKAELNKKCPWFHRH